MKLSVLAAAVGVQWKAADAAVTFLTDHSEKVAQDCVFICIEGRHFPDFPNPSYNSFDQSSGMFHSRLRRCSSSALRRAATLRLRCWRR